MKTIIFLLGPSSVGKSSIMKLLIKKHNYNCISADDIFYELTKKSQFIPWKLIKPKVRPTIIKTIEDAKGHDTYVIDDNQYEILDYFTKKSDYKLIVIILFADLEDLRNRVATREIRRPVEGVLSNLADFFIYKEKDPKVGLKISYKSISKFISSTDDNKITKFCKKFKLPKDMPEAKLHDLSLKYTYDNMHVIDTTKKTQNQVYKEVAKILDYYFS